MCVCVRERERERGQWDWETLQGRTIGEEAEVDLLERKGVCKFLATVQSIHLYCRKIHVGNG